MEWPFVIALVVAVPIVLLPVAVVRYVYINIIRAAVRASWGKKSRQQRTVAGGK